LNKFLTIAVCILSLMLSAFSCRDDRHGGNDDHESTVLENQKEKTMSLPGFMKWCADKETGLNKTKEIGDMDFNLSYLPAEAMAYLELKTESYDLETLQKTCAHYSDMSYFRLRLEAKEWTGELLKYKLSSPAHYENRIKYMSFDLQTDLWLVQGSDTLYAGLYQFERAFEAVPYATVMFAFDTKKFNKEKEFTIIYNDRLFEKGFIKFNYKDQQLTNLPHITAL
jgi:hypothetical protein